MNSDTSHTPDPRLAKILDLLVSYSTGDFTVRGTISDKGDELDAILLGLNTLAEEAQSSGKIIKNYEARVNAIMEILLKYTLFDFSEKASVSEAGDEIDAIAIGLNTLGEELEASRELETTQIQKIRESEERLRILIEGVKDYAIVMIDPEGCVSSWNTGAQNITGYNEKEIVGQSISVIYPQEDNDRHELEKQLRKARDTGRCESEGWKVKKDGSRFFSNTICTVIYDMDDNIKGYANVIRDVTAQKHAEEVIRESTEQIETIIGSAPNAMVVTDEKGNIIRWNAKAETTFGWTAAEAKGKPMLDLIFPPANGGPYADLQRFIKTRAGQLLNNVIEITARKQNGDEFPVELGISTVKSRGEYIFIVLINEITRRKKAENEIRRANLDLDAANKELEAFTYSVSHDLRAPLRAIHGYTNILAEDFQDKLTDEGRMMMRGVLSNTKKMGQLIDDLLSLSRLGKKELQKKPVDMNLVVKSVIEELTRSLPKGKIEFRLHPLPETQADYNLMVQVFTNLISNAIKYSSLKEKPVVEIGVKGEQGEQAYYVSDNGAGFDMAFYNKLFGVFQRLHDANEFEGTGVGLAIVKRIITRHNGKIWAEAQPGKGATFYFTIG
ncbi:MAG: PAS domain-containing sensor histidine kinase [Bacteroidia bacterium]